MKKLLLLLSAVFVLASCSADDEKIGNRGYDETSFETNEEVESKPILPEEECDFGNFQWGMAVEDVVNVHGGGYSKPDENTIRYERVRTEGFASDAEYVFTEGKLSGATYFIMPDTEYEDKTKYIDDYEAISAIYTKRFGNPSEEETELAEGKEAGDKLSQAQLLSEGNILFRKVWVTDTTEIRAVMAKKGDICIGVKITPVNK